MVNHYSSSQGPLQSNHGGLSSQQFSSTAHAFTSPTPYLSAMGLLPNTGSVTGDASNQFMPPQSGNAAGSHHLSQSHHVPHHAASLQQTQTQPHHQIPSPNSTGLGAGSLNLSMPSTISAMSVALNHSVRPAIVKRARNQRGRPSSRAASAMEGDAGSVMFAAQNAAVVAATNNSSTGFQARLMQQQQQQHVTTMQAHSARIHDTSLLQAAHGHAPLPHYDTSLGTASQGQALQSAHHLLNANTHSQLSRHLTQSQPNMLGGTGVSPAERVYESDGIQFKLVDELPDAKVKRLKSEKIKPIEELTFEDIKAYNRNQLRAYCFVYGIKRRKKAEMEQNMARYAAMFHPGDASFDINRFVPTDYLPGPIPRRKIPVSKEQKALSAGTFAARFLPTRPRGGGSTTSAFTAPAVAPSASHYSLSGQRQTANHSSHTDPRDTNDALGAYHAGSGVMVPSHLLGELGE